MISFYAAKENKAEDTMKRKPKKEPVFSEETIVWVHQCPGCFTIYDAIFGEPENHILAGTSFENLPPEYCCPLCEGPKNKFTPINKLSLNFVAL